MPDLFPASDFDEWAENYDRSITGWSVFPFAEYEHVMERVVALAAPRPGMRILDLGTGTGNLALPFAGRGCDAWCTDFSASMLAKAREKMPSAHFLQHDLRSGLPDGFEGPFERILSAYVFHHFDLAEKIRIIEEWMTRLAPGGKMLIADIAFPDGAALEVVRQQAGDEWEEEYYWLADEILPALREAGLTTEYEQVCCCAGVFSISCGGD